MPNQAVKDHQLFLLMFAEVQDLKALKRGEDKVIKPWKGITHTQFHDLLLNPEKFTEAVLSGDEFQKNIYMDYALRIRFGDQILDMDDEEYKKVFAKQELASPRSSERYLPDLYAKGWLGRRKEGRGYQYFVPMTFNHLVLAKVCEHNGWLDAGLENHEWFVQALDEVARRKAISKQSILSRVNKAVENYHKNYQLFLQMKAKEFFTNLWTDQVLNLRK